MLSNDAIPVFISVLCNNFMVLRLKVMARCDARPSRVDTWWKMIHSRIRASAEAPSFLFQVETDTGCRTVGTRCTTHIKAIELPLCSDTDSVAVSFHCPQSLTHRAPCHSFLEGPSKRNTRLTPEQSQGLELAENTHLPDCK